MSFTHPLLREPLHRVKTFAERAGCTTGAVYDAIKAGRLTTVTIDGVIFITETEAERFLRDWPSGNRGVSARWREFRAWKASQAMEAA